MKKMTTHNSKLRQGCYRGVLTVIVLTWALAVTAQPVVDSIRRNPAYSSCNYNIYPSYVEYTQTPAPAGKKPFYISHYGRHGSRYISNRKGYDTPFNMMQQAEAVDELTKTGRKVLAEMKFILNDSENRWGELTSLGGEQHRLISRRMMEQFPEVFEGKAHVSALSTVVPRCMVSMGFALTEMTIINPKLQISMESSKRNQHYMNYQDPYLRKNYMTPEAQKAYNEFIKPLTGNSRLMELIFKNPDIVKEFVNEEFFNYYLMKMGLFILNTHLYKKTYLMSLFTTDELYRMWQIDNALWYIQHGACKLNGGRQPYSQRHLLRQLIADADSCLRLDRPGVQLRFGHDTVLLPLVCLMGINGYDLETDNLNELEARGWWSSNVFPMGGNVQLVFYRKNKKDHDVLIKVLLNEKEATLPIQTDCAPYYHWTDFRRYYLDKIDRYTE